MSAMRLGEGRVEVLELAAWGFDKYSYRPHGLAAQRAVSRRETYHQREALQPVSAMMQAALRTHEQRADLAHEMRGLAWSTGVIDLHAMLSFQRRLAFDPLVAAVAVPQRNDDAALLDICFAQTKPVDCDVHRSQSGEYVLQSEDPNLQMRAGSGVDALSVYTGSPFMEAAEYRGRWFLRDGYHRVYRLLQQGIHCVPALIVHARSVAELGATQPRFFSEDILFSDDPPRLTDFLEDSLTLRYNRPALLRRLRVTVEESFVIAPQEGEPQ